ncbi:MAG: hypothetical protein ACO3CS_10005, partial [Alphaproteobacteria bacterium]
MAELLARGLAARSEVDGGGALPEAQRDAVVGVERLGANEQAVQRQFAGKEFLAERWALVGQV